MKDGSGAGAAYVAAVADRMEKQGLIDTHHKPASSQNGKYLPNSLFKHYTLCMHTAVYLRGQKMGQYFFKKVFVIFICNIQL